TANRNARETMDKLQAAGVPAGVVQSQADLWEDPQLEHRKFFTWLDHAECGPMPYDGLQFLLSKTPGSLRMPQALIGQHNDVILREKLGMSDDEIGNLVAEGVLEAS
ncbi:MAG TPA: CoA transferase, partial [Dehalococcoidia bacterium]|nr:CoA transferase [Dehalococcoidia bacterium]